MNELEVFDPKAVVAASPDPTTAVVALLGQAKAWLAEAQQIEDVVDLMAKAEAIRAYTVQAKLGREAENAACEIRVRAERRIGELLGPTTPGHRTDLEPSAATEGSFTHHERHEFRKMAAIPEPDFEERVEQAKDEGRVSRAAVMSPPAERPNPDRARPEDTRNPHLHIRIPQDQLDGLDNMAQRTGSSVPEIVRELIALALVAGTLTPLRAAVFPNKYPNDMPGWAIAKKPVAPTAMPTVPTPTGCLHPTTAHQRQAFRVVCGLCGGVVRVTS